MTSDSHDPPTVYMISETQLARFLDLTRQDAMQAPDERFRAGKLDGAEHLHRLIESTAMRARDVPALPSADDRYRDRTYDVTD